MVLDLGSDKVKTLSRPRYLDLDLDLDHCLGTQKVDQGALGLRKTISREDKVSGHKLRGKGSLNW